MINPSHQHQQYLEDQKDKLQQSCNDASQTGNVSATITCDPLISIDRKSIICYGTIVNGEVEDPTDLPIHSGFDTSCFEDRMVDLWASSTKTKLKLHAQRVFVILFGFACLYIMVVVGITGLDNQNIRPSSSNMSKLFRIQQFLFDNFLPFRSSRSNEIVNPSHQTRSILLVLHAEATPESPYIDDPKRPLTAKGIRDAETLGVYLREHNIPPPDWIFSSPTIRTSYTLELIRRHWAQDVPVAFENILYILAFNDYFAFCAGLNFNFHRVLIVGHNPAILNTAKKLMSTQGIEDFPTTGFMELRWDHQELWMDLIPGTGITEIALSPENSKYFNVTVVSKRKAKESKDLADDTT